MATESRRIQSTDPGYSVIHDAWVANARSAQFDILFSEEILGTETGGAIFHVVDTSATNPDFYMRYSKGPTLFNENSASPRPSQRGFLLLNEDYWKTRMWFDADGRLKIRMDDAPNELA